MKLLFFSISVLFAIGLYAQDGLSPITANPDLFGKEKIMQKSLINSFDSTVVYVSDTLSLPFFDDFSRNNFQKYDAQPGDAGLTEELFYKMLQTDGVTPMDASEEFTETKTYRVTYDPVLDTTIFNYFDSVVFLYDDLSVYQPNYSSTYGFPPFYLYDTLDGSGSPADTIWIEDVEFKQDSARVFYKQINEPTKLWLNEQAYHNYRFAVNPWSIGVVTFDGLDEFGYPYNFSGFANQENDVLLSKPIDMSAYTPNDSIYFSFLYQKEGLGEKPEAADSLFLDFYSPVTQTWQRVWRTEGGGLSDFKVAHIRIIDPAYFHKGFQFRFINFSSPAGGLDHFHIDYVNLRTSSGYQDTLFKDFAMVYPIATLLDTYTSVPWKHYRANPTGKMSNSVKVTVRNGSELTENNQNGEVKIYYEGNLEGTYTLNASTLSGGDINYAPRTTYESLHDFSTGYAFDHTKANDTAAYFDYEGIVTAQFPNNPINDTTFSTQVFENYYAYDDGTAERAYGVTGVQGMLAVRFDAYQPDSLIGIKVHFVPTVDDVSNNLFLLRVWGDNNGKPGELIYEDEFFYPRQPIYTTGKNEFYTYVFKDTMKVPVDEIFYVGMRQIDEERLNIGFDRNTNNADKIFWSVDTGANWYNASYEGSVMIRPVVTSKMDYTLGVKPLEVSQVDYDFMLYPNPSNSVVNIKTDNATSNSIFQILDLNGRVVAQTSAAEAFQVDTLKGGVYLVNRIENNQVVKVKKLVVY